MTKHKTRKFKPGGTSEADIGSLISAPLIAASHANSVMAREQAKFLMDYCFSEKDDLYTPVMIEMNLKRSVLEPDDNEKDGYKLNVVETIFQVPMITMIPISSLAVETVDVKFDLEISSQHTINDDFSDEEDHHTKPPATKLKGKISYDTDEKISQSSKDQYRSQNSSTLHVNVHAGQLPLPVGVTMMIDLFSKTVSPITLKKTNKS